ncbi:DNA glycosylase [Fomitopsis serialis]|uniref:DNA glycosylase n=1 Tax=Fomitopsis serialis TaxID=139415 RepID=UPI00200850A8|nr:DNA glycosylase [Neoantrodia serialis]KAH9932862.1 DNA glycosylase [Neoantrodia serialis]
MPPKVKRSRSPTPVGVAAEGLSPHKDKKLKLLASHTISSPFPDFTHPTPAEAAQVHDVLASAHSNIAPARSAPMDANDSAGTCGKVPDVLESLIGTILSQNTTSRTRPPLSTGLIARRRRCHPHWRAREQEGGGHPEDPAGSEERHGIYSLQHLAGVLDPGAKGKAKASGDSVSDEEAMKELVSYDGVGPKTASCVLLFCLGRSSFPVDTHVFRLSKCWAGYPARRTESRPKRIST